MKTKTEIRSLDRDRALIKRRSLSLREMFVMSDLVRKAERYRLVLAGQTRSDVSVFYWIRYDPIAEVSMRTYVFNGYGYKVTLDIGKIATILIRSNDNQERFEFTGSKDALLTNVKTWSLPARVVEWVGCMVQ